MKKNIIVILILFWAVNMSYAQLSPKKFGVNFSTGLMQKGQIKYNYSEHTQLGLEVGHIITNFESIKLTTLGFNYERYIKKETFDLYFGISTSIIIIDDGLLSLQIPLGMQRNVSNDIALNIGINPGLFIKDSGASIFSFGPEAGITFFLN